MVDAERFYATQQPSPTAAPPPQGTSIADRFYPDMKEPAPTAPRKTGWVSPEERLFPSMFTPPPPGQAEQSQQPAEPQQQAADAVPERYEFQVPEDLADLGFEPDPELHAEFSSMARGMGLSQERAQQLVDYHLRRLVGLQ